jgi:hypothetical protein
MNKRIVICIFLTVAFLAPKRSQARWLNPGTGRFQTMDTYEGNQQDPQSLHKYTYAHNNPINNADPSGHEIVSTLAALNISSIMLAQVSPATAAAAVAGGAAGGSRSLTQGEITLATSMFGGKINYTKVNVFQKKQNPAHPKDALITPNGNIYAHPKGTMYSTDFSTITAPAYAQYPLVYSKALFIHEMTHVWQFQTGVNVLARAVYRKYDYNYSKLGTTKFTDYGIEQQASIVEDYYVLKSGSQIIDQKGNLVQNPPSLQTYQKVTSPHFP